MYYSSVLSLPFFSSRLDSESFLALGGSKNTLPNSAGSLDF